ncbi:lipopolysaccharide biosynthesis protein [Phreatobacter sp.]|uniref:lipopolysaccharide biosynthesis protein n=1 Tax=Phreatobacter sp. TaxID=1966341 RepID=UPI003F6FFD8D
MLLRQTTTYLFAHGISAVLGFVSVILFTRMLTPAQYGVYVVAFGVAGVFSSLLFTWVRLSVLRFESEGRGADVRLTALFAYLISVATTPVVLGITVWVVGMPVDRALAALALALALGLFDLGQEILKARLATGAYLRATILRAVVAIGLSLMLIQAGWGGFGLIGGVVGAYLIAALASLRPVWQGPRKPFDREVFDQMARFGLPMALSGLVFALHSALDRLLVAWLLGDAAAGIYGVAADLVRQIILFPAMAVGSALAPLAIRALSEGGRAAADDHLTRSGELMLAVILPAVVGLAIIAPHLAELILGEAFRATAAALIPILAYAWLFQVISQQYVQVSFHLAKKPRLLVLHGLAALVVNVACMLVLVPRFGLKGAALSLVIAEAAGVVAGFFLSRFAHPLPVNPWPILKVVAAVAAMAVPTLLVETLLNSHAAIDLVISVGVGVAIYGLAVLAFDIAGIRSVVAGRLSRWRSPVAR